MNSPKVILLMAFMSLYVFSGISQTNNKKTEYVIQVATYANMKAFTKNMNALDPLQEHGMVVRLQPKKEVYAYLLDTYGNFTSKEKAAQRLKSVKKMKGFKTAFVKGVQSDYSRAKSLNDSMYPPKTKVNVKKKITAPKNLPKEFSAKGATIKTYKIQLGCYGSMKSADEIAASFNLSNYEKNNIDKFIIDDFTNVDGEICRRYYFGNFYNKADALKRKKAMEKASGADLKVVQK